jgi:hypothetical protein
MLEGTTLLAMVHSKFVFTPVEGCEMTAVRRGFIISFSAQRMAFLFEFPFAHPRSRAQLRRKTAAPRLLRPVVTPKGSNCGGTWESARRKQLPESPK